MNMRANNAQLKPFLAMKSFLFFYFSNAVIFPVLVFFSLNGDGRWEMVMCLCVFKQGNFWNFNKEKKGLQ